MNEHKAALAYGKCLFSAAAYAAAVPNDDWPTGCCLKMAGLPARQSWLSAQLIVHMHACFDPTAGKTDTARLRDSIQKLTADVQEFRNSVIATVKGLTTGLQDLRTELQGVSTGVQDLRTIFQGMRTDLQDMRLQMDITQHNSMARSWHALALRGDTKLKCLKKERRGGEQPVGAQPASPPYPATVTDLGNLTHAEIDALAEFYSEDFGPSVSDTSVQERLLKLAHFLGVPR